MRFPRSDPTSTTIVMPVRDQLALTASICEQIRSMNGWHRAWIFDNGSVDGTLRFLRDLEDQDPRFFVVEAPGARIYDLWELGIRRSQSGTRPVNVAVLNNDLVLAPDTFTRLSAALRSHDQPWVVYPDYDLALGAEFTDGLRYTSGTYRHGGMSGFCFMVAAERLTWEPLIDRRLRWWGGDDDLAFAIEQRGGKQARVLGLPVWHMNEGTARHHDLAVQKQADLDLVLERWGR